MCRHIADSDARVKEEDGMDGGILPSRVEEIPKPAILTLTSQTDKGPKHLYTGLQRLDLETPLDGDAENIEHSSPDRYLDPGKFPNGITVTQVPPSNVLDQASSKQKRTFGEVFRPHRSLKALETPRPSRNAIRGSSLGWVNQEELAGSEKPTPAYKSDYRYASLPTGLWLQYNSTEASASLGSESKRRQKDRALSFGESRVEAAEEILEHEQARTKALFQAAYSSFAPSVDNSAAVVSERTRSQAWWNKTGQKRFQALYALQYPESDLNGSDPVAESMDLAEDDFQTAVATFEEDPFENPLEDQPNNSIGPKDVDEVLQEISDLLQTLSSYQRIRNLSKTSNGPATPTSGETDVYEILRSNLSILVNTLPPYAVAKLNGDQLEALNVSTNIVINTKDHVGTMEADEYSRQRQRVAMAATHPVTSRSGASVGTAGRPGNYTAQPTAYSQRPSHPNAPRTPYTSQPRPSATYGSAATPQASSYSAARPAPMSTQRPGFPTQQTYTNQTYSQGPTASQFQRPSSALQNGYGPGYIQNVNSQAYAHHRQGQSSYAYPSNQSPQKPVQSSQVISSAQPQYPQHQQPHQSQGVPAVTYNPNQQGGPGEQARNQLQAQRQLSGTPQAPSVNGQYSQMARSSTPGRATPNGRPVMAAGPGAH